MNTNRATETVRAQRYRQVIDWLDDHDKPVAPSLRNSTCPTETGAVVAKYLDSGVSPGDLTTALAEVFDYPVYDKKRHGKAMVRCPRGEWLLAQEPSVLFVADPFRKISPDWILEKPRADKITAWGLLPAARVVEKRNTEEVEAESTNLIRKWLSAAFQQAATDVHITPLNTAYVRIAFRIDGQLVTHEDLHLNTFTDNSTYQYVCNVLMRMCGIEAGMFLRPQDGQFTYDFDSGRALEVRVAMRPVCVAGECTQSFWLRLLNPQSHHRCRSLHKLGLAPETEQLLRRLSHSNQKLILLTGPTGSGKSTTLYCVLQTIQEELSWKSIQTLEDPVEVYVDGIHQTQINADAGMSFAQGLRSLMRSDVDVILIGEIRDEDTAQLAVRASLTGHLVLATVHCPSAVEAVGRMLDFRVSPQLLATVLAASFAQRLVRKSCPFCSDAVPYRELADDLNNDYSTLFADDDLIRPESPGCDRCRGGYNGRLLVSEALPVSKSLALAIIHEDHFRIQRHAEHAITLWQHAARLVRSRQTSLNECERQLPAFEPCLPELTEEDNAKHNS